MSDTKNSNGLESLIEATTRGLREKNDFSGRWCKHFSEDCAERLRQYGETGSLCANKCEYCNKFKWAVDRAKHYAEKTGIPYLDILRSWEERRDYWYMNYYQDCKQPKIEGNNVRVFDTFKEYQNSLLEKGFRCPSCGIETQKPHECTCGWKAYGFLGCLGKGVTVFVKENMALATFMPIAWEDENEQ